MATYCDDPVDSYFYSSYNPYTGRYPRAKDGGWKYKSYLSHYGDSDAFNNQQRAQLKSILSQINPKLTPRLRKANTKDVAVQVNPKKDASVQCSIGPRTLLAMKRDFLRRKRQEPASSAGSPRPAAAAAGGVRYPRNLAVYSPIAYRSVTSFLVDDNNNDVKEASCGEEAPAEPPGDPPESAGHSDGKRSEHTQPAEEQQREKVKARQVKSEEERSKDKGRVRFQVSLLTCSLTGFSREDMKVNSSMLT